MVQGPIAQEKRPRHPKPQPPDWYPSWKGETCVIVASGPSAAEADLKSVQGRAKVITINSSWRLAPWADVLYACDARWWEAHKGVPDFKGLKVTQDTRIGYLDMGVELVRAQRRADKIITNQPGVVGWGGNSGFQCLNLAIVWGAKRVILVGYDMRLDNGVHWHGLHQGMNNPSPGNVNRWRRALEGVASQCNELGVEVLNASPVSELKNYRKVTLEEALDGSLTAPEPAGAALGGQADGIHGGEAERAVA